MSGQGGEQQGECGQFWGGSLGAVGRALGWRMALSLGVVRAWVPQSFCSDGVEVARALATGEREEGACCAIGGLVALCGR